MILTLESCIKFLSLLCSDRQQREMDSEKVSSEGEENALDRIREWVILEMITVGLGLPLWAICFSAWSLAESGGTSHVSLSICCLLSYCLAPPRGAWKHPLDTLPSERHGWVPLSAAASWGEKTQLPQPFFVRRVLLSLNHLCCPLLDLFQDLPVWYWGARNVTQLSRCGLTAQWVLCQLYCPFIHPLSLPTRLLWKTVSKALLKSKETIFIAFPSSIWIVVSL